MSGGTRGLVLLRAFVRELSSDVLRSFLDHLEQVRRCSIRTRNQRLAAVHAMARFIAERSPEHIAWCSQIRAFRSSGSPGTNSPTWTSPRWKLCSQPQIAAQYKACAIMGSCFSSTTFIRCAGLCVPENPVQHTASGVHRDGWCDGIRRYDTVTIPASGGSSSDTRRTNSRVM